MKDTGWGILAILLFITFVAVPEWVVTLLLLVFFFMLLAKSTHSGWRGSPRTMIEDCFVHRRRRRRRR